MLCVGGKEKKLPASRQQYSLKSQFNKFYALLGNDNSLQIFLSWKGQEYGLNMAKLISSNFVQVENF